MIFITGGAYQGKLRYAVKKYSVDKKKIADGRICTMDDALSAECITNFHLLIKRLTEENEDTEIFCKLLCEKNSKAVMITDEIGCGIIPLEKSERIWRENAGRAGCIIAENSSTVIRIQSGIPTVIKGR